MFSHSAINQKTTPLLGGNQFGAQNRWRWCWSLPLRCKNGLAYAKEIEKEARAISLLWHIKNRTLCAGSYCSWSISPSAKNFAHKKRHQRLPLFYSVRPQARKVEFFSLLACISDIGSAGAARTHTHSHTPQGATHAHKHSLRGHKEREWRTWCNRSWLLSPSDMKMKRWWWDIPRLRAARWYIKSLFMSFPLSSDWLPSI